MKTELSGITQQHQVKKLIEVDMEDVEGGVLFYYRLIFICGEVWPLVWLHSDEEINERDYTDTPYDPFVPGQWIEILSNGVVRALPTEHMKGGKK